MPTEILDILKLTLLNPATMLVGYWLGRYADQRQKAVVAGFAAGVAGTAFVWLIMALGFIAAKPRLIPGVLVLGIVSGVGWAALGYWTRQHRSDKGR